MRGHAGRFFLGHDSTREDGRIGRGSDGIVRREGVGVSATATCMISLDHIPTIFNGKENN